MNKDLKELNKTETEVFQPQEQQEPKENVEAVEIENAENAENKAPEIPKMKINVLYIIAVGLFAIAFFLLIAAMVICLVENSKDHNSFYAIVFSGISAGLALLGIIFVCASKDKVSKKKKHKSKKKKSKSKHMKTDDEVDDAVENPEKQVSENEENK